MQSREVAKTMVCHLLGDGNKTLFWQDPWHPGGILMNSFPGGLKYDSTLPFNALVSNVVTEGKWAVPHHISCSIPYAIIDLVQTVSISHNKEDHIVWLPTPNGFYTMPSTYMRVSERRKAKWSGLSCAGTPNSIAFDNIVKPCDSLANAIITEVYNRSKGRLNQLKDK
ncbi:hypothetical protein GIB67_008589 [Kingdonia uniflora]|uniref:Uncharacterized protein n=1 Tax=Kingdonia uniflora TaxID=39325 RepID=A0A7J7N9B9_9MAGN|nr:hypothetical protein GIB67_008589 [Kingdonia uniflora]